MIYILSLHACGFMIIHIAHMKWNKIKWAMKLKYYVYENEMHIYIWWRSRSQCTLYPLCFSVFCICYTWFCELIFSYNEWIPISFWSSKFANWIWLFCVVTQNCLSFFLSFYPFNSPHENIKFRALISSEWLWFPKSLWLFMHI